MLATAFLALSPKLIYGDSMVLNLVINPIPFRDLIWELDRNLPFLLASCYTFLDRGAVYRHLIHVDASERSSTKPLRGKSKGTKKKHALFQKELTN